MDLNSFLGKSILATLNELKTNEAIAEYSKVEGDEFLKLPERGVYFQAKNGTGIICDYRIYFETFDNYIPASGDVKGRFVNLVTMGDIENHIGPCKRDIRAMKITDVDTTLPGKLYIDRGMKVSAYTSNGTDITYIHIKSV